MFYCMVALTHCGPVDCVSGFSSYKVVRLGELCTAYAKHVADLLVAQHSYQQWFIKQQTFRLQLVPNRYKYSNLEYNRAQQASFEGCQCDHIPTPCSMQCIQNLGLAVVPLIAGEIVDYLGYLMLEIFFIACLWVALIAGTHTQVYTYWQSCTYCPRRLATYIYEGQSMPQGATQQALTIAVGLCGGGDWRFHWLFSILYPFMYSCWLASICTC